MEIERKFLITKLPADLEHYPFRQIEQAYLSRRPVIRVRRQDRDFILTVKGYGGMAHEEFELPLDQESYARLAAKGEGSLIRKRRYLIPLPPYTIELDVFEEPFDDMVLAEVEFPSVEEAEAFTPPAWFGPDVTDDRRFRNAAMTDTRYPDHSFWKGVPAGEDGAGR